MLAARQRCQARIETPAPCQQRLDAKVCSANSGHESAPIDTDKAWEPIELRRIPRLTNAELLHGDTQNLHVVRSKMVH
jgi:hypothetical protein